MKPLTSLERRALNLADHKGGAQVVTTRKAKGKDVTRAVANRLVAKGYATVAGERLLTTKAGRGALRAVVPEGPDVFLRARDGLTVSRRNALVGEGPVMDTATLDGFWREQALRNRAEAQDAREHARKLSRAVRRLPAPVRVSFDENVIRRDEAA